jgi:hypothetical protein
MFSFWTDLAWGPDELPSAEDMDVHPAHRLLTVLALVDHQAIAVLQVQALSNLFASEC